MSVGSKRANRAEQILTRIGERLGLSEEGRQWLIMALDPFNDSRTNHSGFPDGKGAKNLVEQCRETATISAPSGILSSGVAWDMMVVQLPWVLPQKFAFGSQITLVTGVNVDSNANLGNYWYQSTTNAGTATIGGLLVMCAPSSQNKWDLTNWAGTSSQSITNITPDPSQVAGNYRVTNCGFEVANTTAPLYRAGSCIVGRTPVPTRSSANPGMVVAYGGTPVPSNVLNIDSWPYNSEAAFLPTDSIQHLAELGCYVPAMINDLDNMSIYKTDTTCPFIVGGGPNMSESQSLNLVPFPIYVNTPVASNSIPGFEWSNFHMGWALFTGLSPQTTFQINVKWGVERFPSQNNAVLAPFAKACPKRDNIALELYSHIIQDMPVGADFNANGFGDWIQDAIGTVADFVAPVLSAIPHPIAQSLATGIKGVNTMVQKVKQTPRGPQAQAQAPAKAKPAKSKSAARRERKAGKAKAVMAAADKDMARFSG